MSGFEPGELPYQAGALPTQPPILFPYHYQVHAWGSWGSFKLYSPTVAMTDCDILYIVVLYLENKKVLLFPVLPPRPAPWSPIIIWWDSSICIPFKYSSFLPILTQTRCLCSDTVSVTVWVRIRIWILTDLTVILSGSGSVFLMTYRIRIWFSAERCLKKLNFLCAQVFPILLLESQYYNKNIGLVSSVADPNPDPPDPHVFGPPGSGSISQRYGSGSFYHHAKIVRKTLIPTILWLFLNFYLWKMM